MRILFALPLTSLIRHFESVALALADDGHAVDIATPGDPTDWPLPAPLAAHPGVTRRVCPKARDDDWNEAATDFRLLVDCGRYLDEPFIDAGKLRARAFQSLSRTFSGDSKRHLVGRCPTCDSEIVDDQFSCVVPSLGARGAARLKKLARLIEQAIPSDPAREKFLSAPRPDVLLVSPLVGLGSEQADWVKSARALGIPVGFPVFSWDNLTTKGIIHVQPDRVFVWNDIQKREAVEYHGVSAHAVEVTGAPRFDAFIGLKPSLDRERFCSKFSLDAASPIITYVCSSEFVAGSEVEFVERWIQEIRQGPDLASCNVVIRPHPRSLRYWAQVDAARWGRVGLAKSRVLNADQLLYDTLHHSDAVVGLNTSAQIEAGILGRPVFTLLAPGFERGQQGTLHFRYLLRDEGGFVEMANDFIEHRRHLSGAVAGRVDTDHIRSFVERFIRPAGWDRPATPILTDAILSLGAGRRSAVRRWLRGSGSVRLRRAAARPGR